jgi:branched-subunit amino acid transport protein
MIIVMMAGAVFLTRITSTVLLRAGLPSWAIRCLRYVPTAVFAALIAPAVLMPKGVIAISLQNDYLLAGLLSAAVAWRFRNFAATVITGTALMVVLRLWQL